MQNCNILVTYSKFKKCSLSAYMCRNDVYCIIRPDGKATYWQRGRPSTPPWILLVGRSHKNAVKYNNKKKVCDSHFLSCEFYMPL